MNTGKHFASRLHNIAIMMPSAFLERKAATGKKCRAAKMCAPQGGKLHRGYEFNSLFTTKGLASQRNRN